MYSVNEIHIFIQITSLNQDIITNETSGILGVMLTETHWYRYLVVSMSMVQTVKEKSFLHFFFTINKYILISTQMVLYLLYTNF